MIQKGMTKQNLNTAALAQKVGFERKKLKRILTGQSDLVVRDFMHISMALSLDADLIEEHMQNFPKEKIQEASTKEEKNTIVLTQIGAKDTGKWDPLPLENHSKQLISYGFALGCNMLLLCDTKKLQHSSIPKEVLAQFEPRIPVQLDATYHPYNKPQYFDDGLEIKLSFDDLYTCFLPWDSIEQVIFRPSLDEESEESPPEPPKLRLL
jgi:hypothetical protein